MRIRQEERSEVGENATSRNYGSEKALKVIVRSSVIMTDYQHSGWN